MKLSFSLAFTAFVTAITASAHAEGPIAKGPWMQHVTPTSAVVRVEVDPPGPVTLEIGMGAVVGSTDAGAGSVVESREARALHTMLVKGLAPATRYPFTVRAGGARTVGSLTTAPADDSGAAFRFLVYGDNRTDDAAHAAVVRAMVPASSDFLVNTGDLVANGASPSQWQTFFDIEASLMRERPLFSCVGNHELVDGAGAEFVRYFGPAPLPKVALEPTPAITGVALTDAGLAPLALEQLSGTFRWSNARFFMLNGMVQYTSGPTRQWLEKVLDEADKEPGIAWRIVVVHHGPWSSGPHGDNALLQEAAIPQLLRAHKVDLVLAGHDHSYERGMVDGLAYLVSGGGGAPTYPVKKPAASSRRYESVRHFVEASATAAVIQFRAIRPDGSVIERCALRKNEGWDCDRASLGAAMQGGEGGVTSASPGVPSGPPPLSKCGCRAVGADGGSAPSGAAHALLAGLAAAVALRTRRARARGGARDAAARPAQSRSS